MKSILRFTAFVLLTGVLFYISCKKEYSCENCKGNKPPIANAGPDQVITLPTDSVSLDGSASSDPDGTISSYLWTKISGPASFAIRNASAASTVVKNLAAGAYQFELKVTDNGGLSAKDTMQVIVDSVVTANHLPVANAGADQTIILPVNTVNLDGSGSTDPDNNITSYAWTKISGPSSFTIANTNSVQTQVTNLVQGIYQFELKVTDAGGLFSMDTVVINIVLTSNRPPVANAGPDQTITLPINTVTLDGSGSTDPDNNITSYAWTKISGPSSFTIANTNSVQTQVTNLVQGIYKFELKVTDAGNLFSKDTMQLTVDTATVIIPCNNRPIVPANLIQIGSLSLARFGLVIATMGNKIFFAGGQSDNGFPSRVDIYDITTNTWSIAELSSGDRMGMATATVGNKIFFAGGMEYDSGTPTSRVDIYDGSTNTWSTAELSKARAHLAAATIGNKVVFAGGGSWEYYFMGSRVVDIYDNSTNTWTTATLSEGRSWLSATTAGNKIYFAGGSRGPVRSNVSTRIDIFDASTNSWSISNLLEGKSSHGSIAVDGKIYWGSGIGITTLSNQVEIRDINTGISSLDCMIPKYDFKAVTKGDNIIFFTGDGAGNPGLESDHFDIYNTTTKTWSTAVLNQKIILSAIISVNNTIYVAGGIVNGAISNQVWKLEF